MADGRGGWIGVKERMPEIPADDPVWGRHVDVLVASRGGDGKPRVTMARWDRPYPAKRQRPDRWMFEGRLWPFGEIAHWMPLPEPPAAQPEDAR